MTAKRFNYEYFDVYDKGFFLDNGKRMLKDEVLNTLNELHEENQKLKFQNGELLYQIGEVGKNNKTCRECECFIREEKYCWMWDMEVEADDVVVACDQRKVKNTK